MRHPARFRIFLLALLTGAPAAAQTGPEPLPKIDVTVIYRIINPRTGDTTRKMTVAFASQGQRVRIDYFAFADATVPYTTMVFDATKNRMMTMEYWNRLCLVRGLEGVANPGRLPDADAAYTEVGSARIAGRTCRDWRLTVKGEDQGTRCVTADGVLLRALRPEQQGPSTEAVEEDTWPVANRLFMPERGLRIVLVPIGPTKPSDAH
jgi:hypothetical protein